MKPQPQPASLNQERELVEALSRLIEDEDLDLYRRATSGFKTTAAYLKAQAIVDTFGLSHQQIRAFLDACGDDVRATAQDLKEMKALLKRRPAAEHRPS